MTQYRVPVEPQPALVGRGRNRHCEWNGKSYKRKEWLIEEVIRMCPFQVGDMLWVPETWSLFDADHVIGDKACAYRASTSADGEEIRKEYVRLGRKYQWRPNTTMPQWACRIFLEITGLRVQQVQDISEADAAAEGVGRLQLGPDMINGQRVHPPTSYHWEAFREVWNETHGPDAWNRNDWVWVPEFKRIER